jgi:hypothetical protein
MAKLRPDVATDAKFNLLLKFKSKQTSLPTLEVDHGANSSIEATVAIDPKGINEQEQNGHWCYTIPATLSIKVPSNIGPGSVAISLHEQNSELTRGVTSRLRVFWDIASDFEATPAHVFLKGESSTDRPMTASLRVRRKDGMPFRLLKADSDMRALTVSFEPQHGDCYNLTLVYSTTHGAFQFGSIQLITDSLTEPRFIIPVAMAP